MALIEVKNLIKTYYGQKNKQSTNALNGVELTINEGEFLGVMGPSGSGKTTLLNMLSGIDVPTGGNVVIENQDLFSMKAEELALFRRRRMGFVFQEFNLLDSLTLRENIMLPLILDKKPMSQIEEKINRYLQLFDIEKAADKHPYNVSGGQQQRAAVARALVNNPAVIFADEPTGNIDSKSAKAVMGCFERINEDEKATILMVTHDPFAASYCKRIIFIRDGQICFEQLRDGSRSQFFEKIIDSLAVLEGEADKDEI
ncbi:ABC transporter ATP-binding protein [Ruminiclostridium cellobioparum]|uniref:ABC-type antimicrobial peptide transport system, ATPase component n=1 Tax=Ruminiclostridium cellobioparum subsp. termitidis CT1112 TaxID=1195236 RepID=S0FFD4_RUMCE|nr:ABC transporter ATP-binding protein [Ruminiclostridium cellobioparum]EMS69560.1 ABC-type antimicrobial peptide transport system, ATPase component [Ruminiclostridium cellobioparum subsp. termitidis CT1112]